MNKVFLLLITLVVCCVSVSSQTYYYKHTKKIYSNGTASTSVSGGQFITFQGPICFESDKKGIGVGHGIMEYHAEYSNNLKTYLGKSYWGDDTTFKFSKDLTKLNVYDENGVVYVYTRTTAPANQSTCSLIRKKENHNHGGGGTPYYNGGNPGYSGNNSNMNNNSNTDGGYQPSQKKRWKNVTKTVDCPLCINGRCNTCSGKGYFYGIGNAIVDCPNCFGYKTGKCSKCQGRGTIEKIEQVYE